MIVNNEEITTILKHYGSKHQKVKACEELAELQTVILQDWTKGSVNIAALTEEIADVYVVLKQLEIINFLDDRDIQPIIDYKLDRTLNRIKDE